MVIDEHAGTAKSSASAQPAPITKSELIHLSPPHLPEEPLVVIEPSPSWVALNLRDVWSYRELLYFLTWRDLKVRYKQTVLGVLWIVMQPLLMTLIFTVVLGRLARVPSDNIPYPLFAYAGLLPWIFFSGAISLSGNSIVGNAHLITKVYFPRMFIPASAIIGRLVDFAVAFSIMIVLMAFYGVGVSWKLLMLPFFIALISLFALGFGMWTSAVNVKYRDVGIALPVLIQLWMFISPIIYPLSLVPENWRRVYSLNPLVGIIEGFRASLFNLDFNWWAIAVSTGVTVFMLVYAAYLFKRMEKEFADYV